MTFSEAFQILLDSGWLYFAIGAVICIIIGWRAVRRLFHGAAVAEPQDPPERHDHKQHHHK